MNNFDDATKNIKKRTPNLPEILDHPYRILIIIIWKNKFLIKSNKSATT